MTRKSASMVLAAAAVLSLGKMGMGETSGFSRTLAKVFFVLHEKIKSWVYDPSNNRWLCQ